MYLIGSALTGLFGFAYFGLLNTGVPVLIFIAIVLSFVPHDLMYGPQAALIAECFTPRLRYSGCSIGYQLSSVISGGPAPLIATALLAATGSGYAIAVYILFCAIVSIVATTMMPVYTNQDISQDTISLDQLRSWRRKTCCALDPPGPAGRGTVLVSPPAEVIWGNRHRA